MWNKIKNLILVILAFALMPLASALSNVSACGTLSIANEYYTLNKSINSSGTCITIGANNVTLDGMGFSINYSMSALGYGVYSYPYNFSTIKNLNILEGSAINSAHAIYFLISNNGTILNNSISTSGDGSHGVYLSSSSNSNNVSNNNITTSGTSAYGMYITQTQQAIISNNNITTNGNNGRAINLFTSSNSNTITNNTISTKNIDGYGILLQSSSNSNNLTNNAITTANTTAYGVYILSSSNNSISGGSISSSNAMEYYLSSAGITNNFTNTNFTQKRKIQFVDASSWFNYRNDNTNNIWLKTNINAGAINRTLITWSQLMMKWNDTNWTASSTANYNLTGLYPDGNYTVYNTSSSGTTLFSLSRTDSTGSLGSISINLKDNTEINIESKSVSINTYDEKSLVALAFNVTFANSTLTKTWNNQTSFSQNYDNLTLGSATITISSAGYTSRKYYMTITQQTYEQLNAYLLLTSQGQTVRFHVVDMTEASISGVLTTAKTSISGTSTTVEQAYTDDAGVSTLFLDPTVAYNMTFSHPSYTSLTTSVQPSLQDYKVYLSGTSNTINTTFRYGNIQIGVTPTDTALIRHSPGTQWFNYTIIAPSADLTAWGWQIQDNNLNTLYNATFTTAIGGTDTYLLNYTNLTYWIYVDTWFTKGGNTTWNHLLFSLNNVTRMNNTLSDIFDIMKSGKNITSNLDNVTNTLVIPPHYGYKPETLLIIGLIITIIVMSFVSQFFVSNSGGVGVIGVLCIAFLAYAGLISWGIVTAVIVGVIALTYLKGGV